MLLSIRGESIKLNISQIVLINKNTTNKVEFNANVKTFSDILWISDHLCKNYVINNVNIQPYDETMVRCMALLTQTLRTYRTIELKKIVHAFSNISFYEDGDLFAQRQYLLIPLHTLL